MEKKPSVGVGVLVIKGDKVLLQKRKGAHGEGTWSFPGGHLEYGESIEECARREVKEEIGIEIKNLRIGPVTNDIFEKEGKHYVTVYVISDYDSGNPEKKERDKTEEINWFTWDCLPSPLFLPLVNLINHKFDISNYVHKA